MFRNPSPGPEGGTALSPWERVARKGRVRGSLVVPVAVKRLRTLSPRERAGRHGFFVRSDSKHEELTGRYIVSFLLIQDTGT
jgi:hypothetical protein